MPCDFSQGYANAADPDEQPRQMPGRQRERACGFNEWTTGTSACYDNLFPESRRYLGWLGAGLASAPYPSPIDHAWENFLSTCALENEVYPTAFDHAGQEGDWRTSGRSMIISLAGKILMQAGGTEIKSSARKSSGSKSSRAPEYSAVPGSQARCLR